MYNSFFKSVISGAAAALIAICSVPVTGAGAADVHANREGELVISPQVIEVEAQNVRAIDEVVLDDFNLDSSSKYEMVNRNEVNCVKDGVHLDIESGKLKFTYNVNNNQNDNNGWCGFRHSKYEPNDIPFSTNYDGVEFKITGDGSKNTFYFQCGKIVMVTGGDGTEYEDGGKSVYFRCPVYLNFTGEKTIKFPFDKFQSNGHGASDIKINEIDRFSFYVNKKSNDYEFISNETIGSKDNGFVLIDDVRLYKDSADEKYVADSQISYTGTATEKKMAQRLILFLKEG